jgi:hypothetical protein
MFFLLWSWYKELWSETMIVDSTLMRASMPWFLSDLLIDIKRQHFVCGSNWRLVVSWATPQQSTKR